MNNEERLRRASEDVDRATASLTPPPIGQVRRSARLRSMGAAAAVAVGALVLVGGAVLALSPGGEILPGPAGPGETTTTTTTVPALSAPDLASLLVFGADDATPAFELPGKRAAFGPIDQATAEADLVLLRDLEDAIVFTEIDEVMALGETGDLRLYVMRGIWQGNGTDSIQAPRPGECLIAVNDGVAWQESCSGDREPRESWLGQSRFGPENQLFLGRVPAGGSIAVIRSAAVATWQTTRDGYWAIRVDGLADDSSEFIAYDTSGSVVWDGGSIGGPADSVSAPAVDSDASCSGGLFYPETYPRADLPEPVTRTVGKIALFASRCWFDELEDVGGDNFTASFGGDDPSELWTYEEEQGYEPMRWLMSILNLPHGTIETENGTLYVWPAANAHQGDWETTPVADVEALRSLYTDEQMQGFADFGAYIGYRIGIWEDGDWSFFVAGD